MLLSWLYCVPSMTAGRGIFLRISLTEKNIHHHWLIDGVKMCLPGQTRVCQDMMCGNRWAWSKKMLRSKAEIDVWKMKETDMHRIVAFKPYVCVYASTVCVYLAYVKMTSCCDSMQCPKQSRNTPAAGVGRREITVSAGGNHFLIMWYAPKSCLHTHTRLIWAMRESFARHQIPRYNITRAIRTAWRTIRKN